MRANIGTRWLTVIAQDPSIKKDGEILLTKVPVPIESLEKGPTGSRVQVIDYDTRTSTLYKPAVIKPDVDKFDKTTDTQQLINNPDFHSQNVYALVMSTLACFEEALGRNISWSFSLNAHKIKIAPHAFNDANAFYSRSDQALMFGYFQNNQHQWVFTCLSHDVVVHEATHAILDGLRPFYDRPSSPDQAAFHEGFADVIALLSVFKHSEIVDFALGQDAKGFPGSVEASKLDYDYLKRLLLFNLAEEMGKSIDPYNNKALRTSLELTPVAKKKDYTTHENYHEAHALGELFVASVMRSFLNVWIARTKPIVGVKSNLINRDRLVEEGVTAASHLLKIMIRALDYLPPTDILFPDFLSALLTADIELCKDDTKYNYRENILEGFDYYGIRPSSTNGASIKGQWEYPEQNVTYGFSHFEQMKSDKEAIYRFVWENREALKIHQDAFTRVLSVRPVVRTGHDGYVLKETTAEVLQTLKLRASELSSLNIQKPADMPSHQLVKLYGGNTLVFDEYGQLKYNIGTDIKNEKKQEKRIQQLWQNNEFHQIKSERSFSSFHKTRTLLNKTKLKGEW